ncbi:MAG TPA: hypothetical protein VGJ62_07815 [Gemmatimonadaceae bacterium]
MRNFGIAAAAVLALEMITAPLAVSGQMATILKPIQIGIAAGGAIPISDLGNNFNTGFNVTGTVGLNPVGLPVGFRGDVAYNQFGSKGATNVKAKFASVTGNVIVTMAGMGITPYAIGGLGFYHVSSSVTGSTASNDFGFNLGAGVDVPLSGFTTFVEARYNRVSESGGSTSFVPVTVGVMF